MLLKTLTKCVFSVYNTREMADMKSKDLIKKLESIGFRFERHGANHDIYARGTEREEVPRHKEINERLARAILRKWGL